MAMAYGVGRRRALEDVSEDLPYWQYHAVMDDRVRPTHAALNNLILPANHAFWENHFPPYEFNCRCSVTATDEIPEGYNPENPNGEDDTKIFYDERGMPAKAEIGTTVHDLLVEGKLPGVPPQAGLRSVIEDGAKRAEETKQKEKQIEKEIRQSSASGTPVSKALNVQGGKTFKEQIKKATDLIDEVHGDGILPEIPVVSNGEKKRNGFYSSSAGKAVKVAVSRYGSHPELTALHEIGHFMDHQGIIQGKFASEVSKEFNDWRDAVANSAAIKQLSKLQYQKTGKIVVDGIEKEYIVPRKYVKYLLSQKEIWARSYAQFITVKSGDVKLMKQLDSIRDNLASKLFPSQWTDDDFEPISQAIEKLFKVLGWMK